VAAKEIQKSVDVHGEPLYRAEASDLKVVLVRLFAMEQIESVIFDWGGVLIDDPAQGRMQYCARALGVPQHDYAKAQNKFIADFQKGLISEDAFWIKVCSDLKIPKPNVRSLWADALSAAYMPREEMFSMVSSLKEKGYKTALLSNTEVPTMQYFHQLRYDMFDVLVFSCAEATKKPERKIYELTIHKLGARPKQSVFIDDEPEYINGAKEVGLNTILFKGINQVKDELSRLSVKTD
jgi:epoxide hydrolase-like predicted phosphatase